MAGSEIGDQVKVLLAQARKFGASVVLATQSASQLPQDVRMEFDGNTSNKIVLLVGGDADARAAIASLGTNLLTPSDLVAVEKFHGYVRLMVEKAPQPPCYLAMLPPLWLAEPMHTAKFQALPKPTLSKAFKQVLTLAKDATDPSDPNSGREVIRWLSQLDRATWTGLVGECGEWSQYLASHLLANPKREPDKVKRALQISNALYGFPWYFREAYARRVKGKVKGYVELEGGGAFLTLSNPPPPSNVGLLGPTALPKSAPPVPPPPKDEKAHYG